MNPVIVEIGAIGASVALYAAVYAAMRVATRPRGISPAPAGQELGPEPPAIASLLGTGWEVTEDAAEATLLDLAARKYFELRQPDNDPRHTTIHLTGTQPTGLNAYELRIYKRVAGLAVDGVVPLTALTFRNEAAARTWWKHLRQEVVAESRARGLSQRRFGPAAIVLLVVVAGIAAAGIAFGTGHFLLRTPDHGGRDNDLGATLGVALVSFALLAGYAGRNIGERDTAAGRAAASRWLGVREWLRGHEVFAELPPAAVVVWDRYLGYGAALGATRTASAVIDMGMGNRKLVWSSFGGTWHRVRVRYPSARGHAGLSVPKLLLRAIVLGAVGTVLVKFWHPVVSAISETGSVSTSAAGPYLGVISWAGPVVGAGLLLLGAYTLVRTLADVALTRTITGQVLWIQSWRTEQRGDQNHRYSVTVTYYLAVDDGSGDHTVAWGMPAAISSRCGTGDTVRITARPWSRRATDITLLEKATAGHRGEASGESENVVAAAVNRGTDAAGHALGTAALSGALLAADEIAQALNVATGVRGLRIPGPGAMVQFTTADRRPVLMLHAAEGMVGALLWKTNGRGTPLPGIGNAAFIVDDRAVARVGDTTVMLTLLKDARTADDQLPGLLRLAVSRVAR
ncbi:hypothetical protein F4553_000021 [Allocatelliglobosispora scoriae]|uniref:Predicted membrane protein YciQ-like C-terminal domain-containing protein n=1 Tax=Allocatelliglobosispora scoriae TaxID=643052 RepID=A0A841BIN6_9ACTN|nr:DUF2207 domain-containing protein [Allocatelliglobosispora scoriae]MBB5866642.1 hypothetical protein [Allocatelliglobosispora scoriae]